MKYKLNKVKDSTIESFLKSKGIEDTDAYLNVDSSALLSPFLLDNVEDACNTLIAARRIALVVDTDQDGYTSSAIMYNYLKQIKPELEITPFFHTKKQHGLEDTWLDIAEGDFDTVLVPDAGSNDFEQHKALRERGFNIVVIDHHEADAYSEFATVVNNQLSNRYTNKTLSGAGVAYKVCAAMDVLYGFNYSGMYLDLAAAGICADVMDLRNLETHYIVQYGLNHLNNRFLIALKAHQAYSIGDKDGLNPTDIGFFIAPLVNAIIRVGSQNDKEKMFMAFIAGDTVVPSTKRGHKANDTEILAEQIARIGTNCRNKQNKLIDEGIQIVENHIFNDELDSNKLIIVPLDEDEIEDVDSTLTGLIAMKVANKYNAPALILRRSITDGLFKGSGRSILSEYLPDLRQALIDTELVDFAQGHAGAFGCGIEEKNIGLLTQAFNTKFKDCDLGDKFYTVDFTIDVNTQSKEFANLVFELGQYKDLWGHGIEEPVVLIKNMPLNSTTKSLMKGDTLKVSYNNVACIKFKATEDIDKMERDGFIDIVGRININEWMGRKTPQLFIDGWSYVDRRREF